MMPDSLTSDTPSMVLMMGEMRGQLRELIHGFNNLSQTVSGLASSVDKSMHLPAEISELKSRVTALEVRMTALETDRSRREAVMGFGQAMFRSPVLGWIGAAAVAVAAWFMRKEGV